MPADSYFSAQEFIIRYIKLLMWQTNDIIEITFNT